MKKMTRLVRGVNDLATVNPALAAEFAEDLNGSLTAKDLTAYSNKEVKWRCQMGHVWSAAVNNRSRGTTCPYCSGKRPIVGETDLATINPDLAAEFAEDLNGGLTAKDIAAHSGKKVNWRCAEGHVWLSRVSDRNRGNKCPYCTGKLPVIGKTDLGTVNPTLAAELADDLNEGLTAQSFTAHSGKKVNWRCVEGHTWLATVDSRSNGSSCPYCTNQRPVVGVTDLATVNPALAAEFAEDLNEGLTTKDFTAHSHKKVNWRCVEGHVWPAIIKNRSRGSNCPYCTGKYPIVGKTDLGTVNPIIAAELADDLNGGITAKNLTEWSNKKVNWRCVKGHVWPATVCNRSNGNGCPYCTGRYPIVGETDLGTVNPTLAAELADDLNKGVTAKDLTAHSGKKVNWRCAEGHVWLSRVSDRNRGNDCPYCAGRYPIVGKTDLGTVNPTLAAELADDLNEGLTAKNFTAHSGKKVNWRCVEGHTWLATVASRSNGSSCPYCTNQRPVVGRTDLATVNPALAAELADDINKGVTAKDLTAHSGKKVNWRCEEGHVWLARVYDRSRGYSCPYCTGKYPIVGKTDLGTVNPVLAAELADDLNEGLTAEELTTHSHKKVNWRCREGHVWSATVDSRSRGNDCPYCAGRKPYMRKFS